MPSSARVWASLQRLMHHDAGGHVGRILALTQGDCLARLETGCLLHIPGGSSPPAGSVDARKIHAWRAGCSDITVSVISKISGAGNGAVGPRPQGHVGAAIEGSRAPGSVPTTVMSFAGMAQRPEGPGVAAPGGQGRRCGVMGGRPRPGQPRPSCWPRTRPC